MEQIAAVETNMTSSSSEVSPSWEGNPYGIFDEPMRGPRLSRQCCGRQVVRRRRGLSVRPGCARLLQRGNIATFQRVPGQRTAMVRRAGHLTEEDMRRIGLAIVASVTLLVVVG